MKGLPAQHFPPGLLPAGALLSKHRTHLHTQLSASVTPWPPPPRESPLSISSFQLYFGLWARSHLLMHTKLSCLQFYVLWPQLRKEKSHVWCHNKMSRHNLGYNAWRRQTQTDARGFVSAAETLIFSVLAVLGWSSRKRSFARPCQRWGWSPVCSPTHPPALAYGPYSCCWLPRLVSGKAYRCCRELQSLSVSPPMLARAGNYVVYTKYLLING